MPKKVPMRSCIGCMEKKEKRDLVRVIRTPEGEIRLDPTGRANGRGAYLCRNPQCLEKARKKGSLSRTLQCEIPSSVYDELEALLEQQSS
ncbi:MAG: YlxR family protein [Lachnospiraceae bacterium]|jgi:predicted RNA-binding protein YlxR (DUF448 family)